MKERLWKLFYWIGIRTYAVSATVFLTSFLATDIFLIVTRDVPMVVVYGFVYGAFANAATIPFALISMFRSSERRIYNN